MKFKSIKTAVSNNGKAVNKAFFDAVVATLKGNAAFVCGTYELGVAETEPICYKGTALYADDAATALCLLNNVLDIFTEESSATTATVYCESAAMELPRLSWLRKTIAANKAETFEDFTKACASTFRARGSVDCFLSHEYIAEFWAFAQKLQAIEATQRNVVVRDIRTLTSYEITIPCEISGSDDDDFTGEDYNNRQADVDASEIFDQDDVYGLEVEAYTNGRGGKSNRTWILDDQGTRLGYVNTTVWQPGPQDSWEAEVYLSRDGKRAFIHRPIFTIENGKWARYNAADVAATLRQDPEAVEGFADGTSDGNQRLFNALEAYELLKSKCVKKTVGRNNRKQAEIDLDGDDE